MHNLYFLVIIFVSCILQGLSGFGFAVIAAPLGIMLLDHETTVVALTIISFALNLYLLNAIKSDIDSKLIKTLIIACFIGVPLGVYTLIYVNDNILKLIVGIATLIFSILFLITKNKIKQSTTTTSFVGFITGFLQSSIGVGGPPAVLLLNAYDLNPKEIKKKLAILFLCTSLFSLPLFFWNGILTISRIQLGLMAIPFALFGGWVGNNLSDKFPKLIIKILMLSIVIIISIQLIYNSIINLW